LRAIATAKLPTGTVTFLFTDIEGSTRLLHELGERYVEVVADHRRVLRQAFVRHGGVEVDTQGDSFFVAFGKASEALAAATEAGAALADGPIRVRMGVHTGEPLLTEEGYVGIDVHRAARIAAAGHGGQILVSQSTRDLAGADGLRDLGEHRLKDLSAPERIYQLGDDDFPPLKSLNQSNLPMQPTPLIGRERELSEVVELLGTNQLVTLTGAGGSGKTRLAVQVAAELVEDYADGVWFVSLAAVRDAELTEPAIAQVVGARDDLREFLRQSKLLLLLDNVEQLLPDVAPIVASLEVQVLATSRERLNVAAEHEYQVPTLPLEEAVALFVQRARRLKPRFEPNEHVREIARRLDGLPLALELAAARVKVLKTEQILGRIGHSLDLLHGGALDAPERQRTLRATIQWSHELLTADEQQLFARHAVFAGSFDLEAVEAVCDADLDVLQSLVDKSLLRQTEDGRFFMLETIKEFALEQLGEGSDAHALRRRHARHYLALAKRAEPELRGPDQRGWFERLELDHDNLRAALSWSWEAGDTELGLRIAVALWRFWRAHNHLAEGTRVLDALLQPGQAVPAPLRARALVGASRLALDQGDLEDSVARGEEALVTACSSGAAGEIAAATENLGVAVYVKEGTSRALALLEDSIARFRALGDPIGTAEALNNLGNTLLSVGETGKALEVLEEALALHRDAENKWGMEFVLHTLGYAALQQGDLERARARLEESLVLSQEFSHVPGIAWSLEGLAHIAAGRGEDRRAVGLWAAGESIRAQAGVYMQSTEAAIHEEALSLARSRLGEAVASAAWFEGAALDAEDAVAYALSSGRDVSTKQAAGSDRG
jgi:predicted ATPase/class 3 adenylate cyclase